MSSEESGTSSEAAEQFEGLLSSAVEFAHKTIAKYGSFQPFVISVKADGSEAMGMADPGGAGLPLDQLELLQDGLISQRDDLQAYAIAVDVRVASLGSDAIEVRMGRSDGSAVTVDIPYKVKRFRRGVELGESMTREGEHLIW